MAYCPGTAGRRRPAPVVTGRSEVGRMSLDTASFALRTAGRPRTLGELDFLLSDLLAARSTFAAEMRVIRRSSGHRMPGAQARLLTCLENYAAALSRRHLPVPPSIRDDLRLHQRLAARR